MREQLLSWTRNCSASASEGLETKGLNLFDGGCPVRGGPHGDGAHDLPQIIAGCVSGTWIIESW